MILLLVGPSGSGKTRFEEMCKQVGFKRVISTTTREVRHDDKPDAYHRVTRAEFMQMFEEGKLVEYVNYQGNLYGITKAEFIEPCVATVEPAGMRRVHKEFGDSVLSIYFNVPEEVRIERCIAPERGNTREYILDRIEKDRSIFANMEKETTLVFNNNTEEDLRKLLKLVKGLL